jgi:hypothetical protein
MSEQRYVYRKAEDKKTWNVIDTRTNEVKKNCKTPMEAQGVIMRLMQESETDHEVLFKTNPHGAQELRLVEKAQLLKSKSSRYQPELQEPSNYQISNSLFTVVNEDGTEIGFTGWELHSLCEQFSEWCKKQNTPHN